MTLQIKPVVPFGLKKPLSWRKWASKIRHRKGGILLLTVGVPKKGSTQMPSFCVYSALLSWWPLTPGWQNASHLILKTITAPEFPEDGHVLHPRQVSSCLSSALTRTVPLESESTLLQPPSEGSLSPGGHLLHICLSVIARNPPWLQGEATAVFRLTPMGASKRIRKWFRAQKLDLWL